MKRETGMTPAVQAEAAAWLARLRADDRSPADERAFQAWLREAPEHAHAFDAVTTTWELAGGLRSGFPTTERRAPVITRRRAVMVGLGTAVFAGGAFSMWSSAYAGVYETEVGAQKHVALEDGTEAFLDTDTRIRVHFDNRTRGVTLDRGRVNFHVAPDPGRPFVVDAAGRRIVSAQTTFDVRRNGDHVSVVLFRGTASVTGRKAGMPIRTVLQAGERLVATATLAHVDKPNLAPLLAWQSGQAIFENDTLGEAATEMNRYSTIKLEVDDPIAARMRLSGVYRVGDPVAFAHSVATLLPVKVEIADDAVRLVADPARSRGS